MHDIYRPLRNYFREFPLVQSLDLIWAYSQHVANGRPLPERMQFRDQFGKPTTKPLFIYPWELDLIAREIVLNGNIVGNRSLDSWHELSIAINKLRRIDNDIAGRYSSRETVMRDLHRTVHLQFPWQRPPSIRTMMRAYKLFGTDMMRPILEETTGVDLDSFFKLGIATAGHLREQSTINTEQDYSMLGVPLDVSKKFFDRLTVDLSELRSRTREAQRYDDSWQFGGNPLRNTPLVRFDPLNPERVICPFPTFLITRFSEGLFYDTVGHHSFSNAIGKGFETYVGEVLREVLGDGFTVLEEQEYWVGKDRKDGVDWIVSDATGHVFIECKTKRLRYDAKFIADGVGLETAIDAMASFVVQHYRNINEALSGLTKWVPDGKMIYPMIVTLEDWWLFTPAIVGMLENSVRRRMNDSGLPLRMLDDMPYTIASADEFETAFQIMSMTGIETYLGRKCSDAHRQWALTSFSPGRLQTERKATHGLLFRQDLRHILFPQLFSSSGTAKSVR